MSAVPIPNPLLVAHLETVGRWCPGVRRGNHYADNLTAKTGRVLCRECSDDHEVELARKEPA